MKSRKELLRSCRLYVIIDKTVLGERPLEDCAKEILEAKVDIIQYRDKESSKEDILKNSRLLKGLLGKSDTLFILNDFIDIARETGCDGVHLGQDDASVEVARNALGSEKIIGISCHSVWDAVKAQENGADYISIGPVFKTTLKKDTPALGTGILKEARGKIKIPYFAIGGINRGNIKFLLPFEVRRIAVCRALLNSQDYRKEALQLRDFLPS